MRFSSRFIGFVLLILLVGTACSSSKTATNRGAADDAGGSVPNGAVANEAETDATGGDASTSAGDAGNPASDGGACVVEQRCTNPSTPSVPVEISGTLPEACAPVVGEATDLQSRCTIFCRHANTGFPGLSTCVVESATTFHCDCVNP
jgi:hypothetical protein